MRSSGTLALTLTSIQIRPCAREHSMPCAAVIPAIDKCNGLATLFPDTVNSDSSREKPMPALLVADVEVKDPAAYARYRTENPAIVRKYGGRYLAVGGEVCVLEGDWVPRRTIIIEFPDMAALRAFYDSPEYREIRGIRWANCDSRLVAFETTSPQ
jgi:uncharacterized protein (DUF1330 family)